MIVDPLKPFNSVFVTGGNGIVGTSLCKRLVGMGVRVISYSRSVEKPDPIGGIDRLTGDILDVRAITEGASGADVIFHLAAAVHGSAESYSDFYDANVIGTENAILAAGSTGAKLVHVSTVNVDGFRRGELKDDYAATKSKAEELVLTAVSDGLDAVIIRPATVFGNEAGTAGLIVDRLLAGSLKMLPAPSRLISPVWSGDLAAALINAARIGETGRTYTVAGPALTTGAFVKLVCDSAAVGGPILSIPAWVFVIPLQLAWWARGLTQWTPPVSVESLRSGSVHDGTDAADQLEFDYTPISEIFD